MNRCKLFAIICFFICKLHIGYSQILPLGNLWYDTDGNMINAHGGGILKYQNTYYWYGEAKGYGEEGHKAKIGVSCYSSTDLLHWKNEGIALAVVADTLSKLQTDCLIERPKVVYNKNTKKFVMWFHHELKGKGYSAALAGLAIADKPTGPFTYINSIRPNAQKWPMNLPVQQQQLLNYSLPKRTDSTWKLKVVEGMFVRRDFIGGQMARDMTIFIDDNDIAYHIASAEDNQTLHISKLSHTYTEFTGEYYRVLEGQANEAPAIFKYNKKYYLFASGTTGWKPNPGRLFLAEHIYGPWMSLGNPVQGTDYEKATTFQSQSTFILPLGNKGKQFLYMGDRWLENNLAESKYIWLPIEFKNNIPVLAWKDNWGK